MSLVLFNAGLKSCVSDDSLSGLQRINVIFLYQTVDIRISYKVSSLSVLAQSNTVSSKDRNSVGGGCEGCDLMYVSITSNIEPYASLFNTNEKGERLEISGTIYQPDGKTPADGIILYVYQTAASGHYEPGENQTGDVKRHGRIRGWVKSNQKGEYKFSTIRPGHYPNATFAAHILRILFLAMILT
jgi:protocatechuate 3,4-dioxygenase beta subunit